MVCGSFVFDDILLFYGIGLENEFYLTAHSTLFAGICGVMIGYIKNEEWKLTASVKL